MQVIEVGAVVERDQPRYSGLYDTGTVSLSFSKAKSEFDAVAISEA